MAEINDISVAIDRPQPEFEFSVCTFVTRKDEYSEMLQSFVTNGFDPGICEFLHIDNTTGNTIDAYEGVNFFLRKAKGTYIIICHQDVLIDKDDIGKLRNCLTELDKLDEKWAICGNAGAVGPNHIVYHISYPNNLFMSKGRFPQKVSAIDENFVLVKNSTFLKVSNNLEGFHLYATDLCLQAALNGFTSYVIAFNLTHKSRGNKNESFFATRKALIKQYSVFFKSRWIQTNSTVFYLSGSRFGWIIGNSFFRFLVRMINGLKKRFNNG